VVDRRHTVSSVRDSLLERIAINPGVLAGKPVIRGTRLSVQFILGLLASGATVADVLAEYEGLSEDDIQACLLFAAEALGECSFMPLRGEPV
jgi:uncharacterized protein (DUF433 family)